MRGPGSVNSPGQASSPTDRRNHDSSVDLASRRVGVMQMVDTLAMGGAERVAVNLASLLPSDRYRSYLCTTRREGPLSELLTDHVERVRLDRKRTLDIVALRKLVRFLRDQDIRIVHAHGAALFLAVAAALFVRRTCVVWHDHFGRYEVEERPVWLYRLFASQARGVIAVNEALADWSRRRLKLRADRVWYIRNFTILPDSDGGTVDLPGEPGSRIVCVANLRSEKDHLTLIRAMDLVRRQFPEAMLFLVGGESDLVYRDQVYQEISQRGLQDVVKPLGMRRDVPALLNSCDIGVLSSASEGLPLALIEYGIAGLPAVATRVGQCAEVLGEGHAGIVVPPGSPEALAEALLSLLQSPTTREQLSKRLHDRVQQLFGAEAGIQQVCRVYDAVLETGRSEMCLDQHN